VIKITFSNGMVKEVKSFIVNEDSVKLIKDIEVIEQAPTKLFQVEAAKTGSVKKRKTKLNKCNYKLSEETKLEICKLWFGGQFTEIPALAKEYLVTYNAIVQVLEKKGVEYGYINSSNLWKLDRKIWWNNQNNTKVLTLQNV
jgi:hypothetical protein